MEMQLRPQGQPRRDTRRLGALAGLGCAALVATSSGSLRGAFTGGSVANRPTGSHVILDKPVAGATCLQAYGNKDKVRPEWNEFPNPFGTEAYRPSAEMMDDKYRQWVHFDAEGKDVEDLSGKIYHVMRGKDNPLFQPRSCDVGAFAIVTNCEKVRVPGLDFHYKVYFRNMRQHPGSTKVERFADLQARFPERIMMKEVWKCFPKNPISRNIFKTRLKLFQGPNHLYYNKNPVEYRMNKVKDVTHEDMLPYNARKSVFYTKNLPRMNYIRKKVEAETKQKTLVAFKDFLSEELTRVGDRAKDMGVDEYLNVADENRAMDKIRSMKGVELEVEKPVYYPGTTILKKKLGKKSPNPIKWDEFER